MVVWIEVRCCSGSVFAASYHAFRTQCALNQIANSYRAYKR